MTPSEATFFIQDEIEPRVYGKKLDEIVVGDWLRTLEKPWINTDSARAAMQDMADNGSPMRISAFKKAVKRHGTKVVAKSTHPVLLFSIRVRRTFNGKSWTYARGFYANTEDAVPTPDRIAFMASYWAKTLEGTIEYADAGCPVSDSDIPDWVK